ncbi:MAG: hypothetical protein A3F40_01440 [Chlamydiae bacterium RIFCSPHIGHO2_12_FULL_27_8]|nr:MAG: hypothetical protein A3F40_01440 [Chlamydiae bacterium RIFCSPHIGHO2_12_FULL_27_8]
MDRETFHIYFGKPDTSICLDKNSIFLDEDKDISDEFLKKIALDNIFSNLQFLDKNSQDKEKFLNIKERFENIKNGCDLSLYLYSDLSEIYFKNFYTNFLNYKDFYDVSSLKDKFKNKPAVIVGAGPSLKEDIFLLKKIKEKAFIFAGGNAVNFLNKNKVGIDFQGFIDPILKVDCNQNIPTFLQYKVFFENEFSKIKNKIFLPDADLYPLAIFLEHKIGLSKISEDFGWTVSNFLMTIADYLGFSPIILVGMDLSFENIEKTKNGYLKVKGKFNNDLFTKKDFLLSKKWIEDFAVGKKVINATSKGVEIFNLLNFSLSDFLKNPDLNKTQSVFNENFYIRNIENHNLLHNIKKSIENVLKLCSQIFLDFEKHIFDLNLIIFQNEIFYQKLLEPLWLRLQSLFLKNVLDDPIHILINKIIFFKNVSEIHLKILKGLNV